MSGIFNTIRDIFPEGSCSDSKALISFGPEEICIDRKVLVAITAIASIAALCFTMRGLLAGYFGPKTTYFVKTLVGKTITIRVGDTEKIDLIFRKLGIPLEKMKHGPDIVYGGKKLDLNQTFGHYKIPKEATIQVVGRLVTEHDCKSEGCLE